MELRFRDLSELNTLFKEAAEEVRNGKTNSVSFRQKRKYNKTGIYKKPKPLAVKKPKKPTKPKVKNLLPPVQRLPLDTKPIWTFKKTGVVVPVHYKEIDKKVTDYYDRKLGFEEEDIYVSNT